MTALSMSAQDREDIYTVLRSYAWALDTSFEEGLLAAFTPDGTVQDHAGKIRTAAEFASFYISNPGQRRDQHWIQPVMVTEVDGGYEVASYWYSMHCEPDGSKPFARFIGRYVDTCVKFEGAWRIKAKEIHIWRNDTSPPAPPKAE